MTIRARRGLIVEVTESDILSAGGNPMSQTVKLALKGLAFNMAAQLKPHHVAAVAITPGFLRSETMLGKRFGVTEANWREAGKIDTNFLESESPMFVGAPSRAGGGPTHSERTGQLCSSWELAREYRFTDATAGDPLGCHRHRILEAPRVPGCSGCASGAEIQARLLAAVAKRTKRS